VVAQNRGACFTTTPDQPNTLHPRRRPAHTLLPILVRRSGELVAVPGSMGGLAQPQINALTLLRMFRGGQHPAEALAAPRWLVGGADAEGEQPGVLAEADVPEATLNVLRSAGWPVEVVPARSSWVGHAHAIRVQRDSDGVTFDAGCDPRSDGAAAAG
jgi:gamma-glutamyltranspeptidase / glutathione hydrolase